MFRPDCCCVFLIESRLIVYLQHNTFDRTNSAARNARRVLTQARTDCGDKVVKILTKMRKRTKKQCDRNSPVLFKCITRDGTRNYKCSALLLTLFDLRLNEIVCLFYRARRRCNDRSRPFQYKRFSIETNNCY